ncbi:MAG: two-component regulator propeller domain-containing protein [Candidatus Thermochlorobacter sp.]
MQPQLLSILNLRLALQLVIVLLVSPSLLAQSVGSWQNYTSFRSASSLAVERARAVWVGTDGGLYCFNRKTGMLRTFTNIEGLFETRITALAYDSVSNRLWIGYESGALSALALETEQVSTLFELFRVTQFANRAIRKFFVHGDSLYVANDFGLSLFIASRREFRASYIRFGAFASGTAVRDVVIAQNHIIVATALGVARARLSSTNLSAPTEWESFAVRGGANALALHAGKIFVATPEGLFRLEAAGLERESSFAQKNIIALANNRTVLLALTADELITRRNDGSLVRRAGNFADARAVAVDDAGEIFVADRRQSLLRVGTTLTAIVPNSPLSNNFEYVQLDAQGRLWGSSSQRNSGAQGFYRLENGTWRNFENVPSPGTSPVSQFSALVSRGQTTLLGTWGGGLLEFTARDSLRVLNRSNSPFIGIRQSENFVVLPSLAKDQNEVVWIANFLTAQNPIYAYLPNGNILRFGSSGLGFGREFPPNLTALRIAIDPNGYKWIAVQSEDGVTGRGLVVFDDNGTLTDPRDDRYVLLDERQGFGRLPNPKVNDIQFDNDGSVWLATDRGAAYFFDAQAVFNPRVPNAMPVFDLRNEFLSSLAIDALNRKWFGSQNGVWVVSASGDSVVRRFTTENSPLLSNNVRAIAYDRKTGKMYFGTDRGLSVLTTDAVEPQASFTTLKVYPNPFRVPATARLIINGLTRNASVRIVTLSGALVRELPPSGGSLVEWDGKDKNGNHVASGIYLAVAISEDGRQSAVAKIAVIRR